MSVSSAKLPGSDLDTTDSAGIRGNTDGTIIGNVGDRLKVDAITSNGEVATFIALSLAVTPGNNKSMLSLLNASTRIVKLREVRIKNVQNTAVTGVILNFLLNRMTGHSGGTVVTPQTHDTNDTLTGTITARTGATIAGESASPLRKWEISSDEWGVGGEDVESTAHGLSELFPNYSDWHPSMKAITLRQNQGIHIKCGTNSTVGSFDLVFVFTEEP